MNGKPGATTKKRGARGRQTTRPKPKTADELDAEMTDYFGGANGSTEANGAAVQAETVNVGDAGEDEIQVSGREFRSTVQSLTTGQ